MGKDTAKNTKIIALLSNLRSRATGTGSQKKGNVCRISEKYAGGALDYAPGRYEWNIRYAVINSF